MHNGLVNFLDPIAKVWGGSGVHFGEKPQTRRKKLVSGGRIKKKARNIKGFLPLK